MNDIMIDIETMATGPDASILSIGACLFDPYRGEIGVEFKANILLVNQGRAIDPETLEWWLGRSNEAQNSLLAEPRIRLATALIELRLFLCQGDRLWSNGPTFDEVVLRHAFDEAGLPFPIKFFNSRCVRTANSMLKARGRKKPPREGTHHDALADAIYQAPCVIEAYR